MTINHYVSLIAFYVWFSTEPSFTDKRGNRDLIAINSMNLVLYAFTWWFYRTLNKRRDKKWDKMSEDVRDLIFLTAYRC
jgi:hypothetical protein